MRCRILYRSINFYFLLFSPPPFSRPYYPATLLAASLPSLSHLLSLLSDFDFQSASDTDQARFPNAGSCLAWPSRSRPVDAACWGRGGGEEATGEALKVGLGRSFPRFKKLGSLDVKLQFVQSEDSSSQAGLCEMTLGP